MNRPYIVCHMVTSLDGKVTGDFLSSAACEKAVGLYYDIHRTAKADGFICGRVPMEGSFTGGWYPDLSAYERGEKTDYVPDTSSAFYAVAFDTHGKLGWKSHAIVDPDGDPGYDGARIIEVLSEDVDARYLGYLQAQNIPYLFAGKTAIDVETALCKLKAAFGIDTLLLEGGSILNGAFHRAGAVDELSLGVAPVTAKGEDKPLFMDGDGAAYRLVKADTRDDVLILQYKG